MSARGLLLLLALVLVPGPATRAQDGGLAPAQDPAEVAAAEPAPDIVVESPTEPVLLGERFEVVVRGPGLAELHLAPGAAARDVLGEPFVVREDTDVVELRQPLRIARRGVHEVSLVVLDASGAELALPPVEVEVVLTLPVDQRPRVATRLGPVDVPLPPAEVRYFIGGCLVGLALLGCYVVLAGRVVEVVIPPRPPDLVAIDALTRLRLHLPTTADEMLPFTVEVSDVLRTYVEGCFELHAPARTTEEFLAEASQRHDAVSEQRELLEAFLTRCDLVKYARHRPALSESVALIDTVETFIDQTRRPAEPEDADEAGARTNGRAQQEVTA